MLLRDTFGSGRQVEIYAMADGVVTGAQDFQLPTDLAPGTGFTYLGNFASEIELTVYRPAPLGQWVVRYRHVFPTVEVGDHVHAGDVIATGTPAGVGFARKPPKWLRPGDKIEVEIERIGVLANTVISEPSV